MSRFGVARTGATGGRGGRHNVVMTPRTVSLFTLLIAAVLAVSGCKKDDFVKETLSETKTLTEAMVKAVNDASDKKAGVAEAQKLLDEKKDELGKKLGELGELRGFQVSEEVQAQMNTDLTNYLLEVEKLKLTVAMAGDQEANDAVNKLCSDFSGMLPTG